MFSTPRAFAIGGKGFFALFMDYNRQDNREEDELNTSK